MAQYRATIQGNRGEASRCGVKSSGIEADVNGWNIGCRVRIYWDDLKKCDCIVVERTGGSNHTSASRVIHEWSEHTKFLEGRRR